jgi:hypothetical protein
MVEEPEIWISGRRKCNSKIKPVVPQIIYTFGVCNIYHVKIYLEFFPEGLYEVVQRIDENVRFVFAFGKTFRMGSDNKNNWITGVVLRKKLN